MIHLLLPVLLASADPGGCQPLHGDHILAADLGRAIPAFAALPPGAEIGYSPLPGTRRIIKTDELHRIAKAHGIPAEPWSALCFEMAMAPLEGSAVVQAMREALDLEAVIDVQRIEPRVAPLGKLVFPKSSLLRPTMRGDSGDKLVWRGFVQYSSSRRFPVIATVHIHATLTRIVATRDLKVGEPIAPDAVRSETYEGFPGIEDESLQPSQVAGQLLRRSIRAGQVVFPSDLSPSPDVKKGDFVQVEVRNGAARLELQAQAESTGRIGEMIQIKNLQSGKRFGARVEAAGKVAVLPQGIKK